MAETGRQSLPDEQSDSLKAAAIRMSVAVSERDPDFEPAGTVRWELHKDLDGRRCCIKRVEVVGIFESREEARQWMIETKDSRS